MTKLIILPGNSPRNQAWGEAAVEYFGSWFDSVYMQYYDHWQEGSTNINIENELAKFANETNKEDVEYYVFAKSIGSLLTLLATQRGSLNARKGVFFGMPLELASEDLFKGDWSALSDFTVPTIAFHNDQDPISYEFTKQALVEHGPGKLELITKKGDNHNYTEFADYEPQIKDFLAL